MSYREDEVNYCEDCAWYNEKLQLLHTGECTRRTDIDWTGQGIIACDYFINRKSMNNRPPIKKTISAQYEGDDSNTSLL